LKTEYYSIRSQTGELLYIHSSSNGNADCCGDRTYNLDYVGDTVYKAEDYTTALYASHHSTEWYNSTEDRPKWYTPKIGQDVLTVVKVVETIEIEDLEPQYDLAPSYSDDLAFVLNYSAVFDIEHTKDRNKTVFFMKGRKAKSIDFHPGRCVFRNLHLEGITSHPEFPLNKRADKFFQENPNAFIFVTEPIGKLT
jgi:hypothetical protein